MNKVSIFLVFTSLCRSYPRRILIRISVGSKATLYIGLRGSILDICTYRDTNKTRFTRDGSCSIRKICVYEISEPIYLSTDTKCMGSHEIRTHSPIKLRVFEDDIEIFSLISNRPNCNSIKKCGYLIDNYRWCKSKFCNGIFFESIYELSWSFSRAIFYIFYSGIRSYFPFKIICRSNK